MFSSMVDQGILNHLQEIDHLLLELEDIQNIRMQEQEVQLNTFIQEGFIRPLSEREGLFLITQNQLNNFNESIKQFNNKFDTLERSMKTLKENGLKIGSEQQKQEYKINTLEREKLALETILQDHQNKYSSKIDEEEQLEGLFEQHLEEARNNLQHSKIQELTDQVAILRNQLEERNLFINQLELNTDKHDIMHNEDQIEIEMKSHSEVNSLSNNQSLIQTYEKKIQLLYSQVNFYKKQADENMEKVKTSVQSRMEQFEKDLKKQQLFLAEDDEDSLKGVIDIQFSNSRTLQIVELQKQIYFLEDERDKIQKEFETYKNQTDSDMKEMKFHKIEVEDYKKKLDEALKQIKQKTTDNLNKQSLNYEEFKQYALKIELLNKTNDLLKKELSQEQNKVNKVRVEYESNQKKLENELNLKNEIIKRFDPNSDIYNDLQNQLQSQKSIIDQLSSDNSRIKNEKHLAEQESSERIEKLTEENKILLSMCEQIPTQNTHTDSLSSLVNTPNKEMVQQNIANNIFKQLYDHQKKKFQSLQLEYQIIISENQHSKSEKIKLLEENNKINQRFRQLQLTQKLNNKKSNSGSGNNGTVGKKLPKSTIKEYEPLSEDIQNILSINKEYKSKIAELQIEMVGLRQEIDTLKSILNDQEKSQSNNSSYDIELKPEHEEMTDQLLMFQALVKTNTFKNMIQDN